MLTASESSIYGRFGYGVAAWRLGDHGRTARASRSAPATTTTGGMRLVHARRGRTRVAGDVRTRALRTRAGMVSRPDFWWPQVFWDFMVAGPRRRTSSRSTPTRDGNDDGYVVYEISGDWVGGLHRPPAVDHRHAGATSPAAWIALWRYVFGVDLIGTVAADNVPIDDPLRHVVVDSRRVRVDYVNDHLWLAPLDPAAVLGARTYTVPGRVVHRGARARRLAHDGCGGVGRPTGTTSAAATTDAADLVVRHAVLGMCVLGGNRWSELAAAGRRRRARGPRSLALADAMFLADARARAVVVLLSF